MGVIRSVTSFGRSGLSDWLVQRVSAVVMAVYTLFLLGYFMVNPDLSYQQWMNLHSCFAMKVFNILLILSVVVHAWIGLWAVLTDYITVRLLGPKATPIRFLLQIGMIATTFIYGIWAIDIFWGI